jgi:hypothetical protein
MLTRICLSLTLIVSNNLWAQLQVVPFEGASSVPYQNPGMLVPPAISGESYPTTAGFFTRTNYLDAGLTFGFANTDNVILSGTPPVGDQIYTITPSIEINRSTTRQQLMLTYIPGFTFYNHTASLNAATQTADLHFQYRLGPHTTMSANDSFQQSTNVFNALYPGSGSAVLGSPSAPSASVVVPNANRITNNGNFGLTHQFSSHSMVGFSGLMTRSDYKDSSQAQGFYNLLGFGASTFYSRHLSENRYAGVLYHYLDSQTDPVDQASTPSEKPTGVQSHTIQAFYTIYLNPTFSVSFLLGPQYTNASQTGIPSIGFWKPAAMASLGWQRNHTIFALSYTKTVSGSTGLPGAFDSNIAGASASWLASRRVSFGLAGDYSLIKSDTPSFSTSSQGGHSISGHTSAQYTISSRFRAELGYAHLHQSYRNLNIISTNPDSNRIVVSVTYLLSRALGR